MMLSGHTEVRESAPRQGTATLTSLMSHREAGCSSHISQEQELGPLGAAPGDTGTTLWANTPGWPRGRCSQPGLGGLPQSLLGYAFSCFFSQANSSSSKACDGLWLT